MDAETKEKLTELQHQHDLLRTDMVANMKTMKANNEAALAKNESAVDRLLAASERFRADSEKYRADSEKYRADNEKVIEGLRTDIEKALGEFRTTTERRFRVLLVEVACVVGVVVAVIRLIAGLVFS